MTKPHNSKTTIEDQLVKYTDSVLNDQKMATFAPDPELRALEETVLHLKQTLGQDDPDEAAIQRIRNNILWQWKQQEREESRPFWQTWLQVIKQPNNKWQSRQSRQRFNLAVSMAAIVVLLLVSIPFIDTTSSNQPAASGQYLNVPAIIIFGGLILLAMWLFRRKP